MVIMVGMTNKYYMTLEKAKSVLQPRMPLLIGALKKAVHEWNLGLSQYHTKLDAFARGVFINQLWYEYSNQALHGDPGVSLEKNGQRTSLIIDRSLVLRLKHVNEAYRSRNYPTPRDRAWNGQVYFPSIPPIPRLDIGYRMDLTGTAVKDSMVIFSQGVQSLWRWQVWGFPVSEFAGAPNDMFGRTVYSHDDYSRVVMP